MSRPSLVALASGVLFGAGLAVSQMLNPAKVLAFLDVAGNWDPSLALVMGAALAVMVPAWAIHNRGRGGAPRDAGAPVDALDGRLVSGAALFGIGWGLVGYCPGPAMASLALLNPKAIVFVLAMLAGMAAHDRWAARRSSTERSNREYCDVRL